MTELSHDNHRGANLIVLNFAQASQGISRSFNLRDFIWPLSCAQSITDGRLGIEEIGVVKTFLLGVPWLKI